MLRVLTGCAVVGGVYVYGSYRYDYLVYRNTRRHICAIDDKQYHVLLDRISLNTLIGLDHLPITWHNSKLTLVDYYQVIEHAINVGNLDALGVLIHHNRKMVIDQVIKTAPSEFIDQCMTKFPGTFNQYKVALAVCTAGRPGMTHLIINACEKHYYSDMFEFIAGGNLLPGEFKEIYLHQLKHGQPLDMLTERHGVETAIKNGNMHVYLTINKHSPYSYQFNTHITTKNIRLINEVLTE